MVPKILSVNTDNANKTEKIVAHQNQGNRRASKENNDDEKPSANNESEKSKEDNSNIDKIEISKKEQSEVISILNSTKIQTNWTEPDIIEFQTNHPNNKINSKSKPKPVEISPKIKSTEEGMKPGNNFVAAFNNFITRKLFIEEEVV